METSGFASFGGENIEQSGDEVEIGEMNFGMLSSMLKDQMALLHSQRGLQREQAEQMQQVMRQFGKQLEQLGGRLDYLEQKLSTECQQVSSLKEELHLSQRNQNNESIPVVFEIKIAQIETRVEQLERAVELSSWTEDKMTELITSVYANMKTELLEELQKLIVERVGEEKTVVSERRKGSVSVEENIGNSWKAASTPRSYPSSHVTLLTPPEIAKRRVVSDEVDVLTTNSDGFCSQQRKPVPKPRSADCSGARIMSVMEPRQVRNQRPVQKPMPFDGATTWEAHFAQFEMIAQVNGWNEEEKTAFLASSLKGQALSVLGNLRPEDRQNFQCLVTALSNRFGSAHQTELSRVRFKNRLKQRDESLPELSQEIERLARLSYPEASSTLQDVLARDQFIDALAEEETRLKLKHERPKTLQDALTLALEFESFYLASRQYRGRVSREATLAPRGDTEDEAGTPNKKVSESDRLSSLERVEKSNDQLMQVVSRLEMSCRSASREFNRLLRGEEDVARVVDVGIVKRRIIFERTAHC